jgi:hypothetical protein
MYVRLTCPNGHKLKIVGDLVGRVAVCPKCKARLAVPEPKVRQISDTSVLAVLGDVRADKSFVARPLPASPPPRPARPMRTCPKCRTEMSAAIRICPQCKLYQPDTLPLPTLPTHCPTCGAPTQPAVSQCTACGGQLKAG